MELNVLRELIKRKKEVRAIAYVYTKDKSFEEKKLRAIYDFSMRIGLNLVANYIDEAGNKSPVTLWNRIEMKTVETAYDVVLTYGDNWVYTITEEHLLYRVVDIRPWINFVELPEDWDWDLVEQFNVYSLPTYRSTQQ